MKDLDFTLLDENQIFGENRLSIFEKYGAKAAITDFAILLGGYVSNYQYTNEGNDLKDRTGLWWIKTDNGDNDARVVELAVEFDAMLTDVVVGLVQFYLTL